MQISLRHAEDTAAIGERAPRRPIPRGALRLFVLAVNLLLWALIIWAASLVTHLVRRA
jgi:hypothetical protein